MTTTTKKRKSQKTPEQRAAEIEALRAKQNDAIATLVSSEKAWRDYLQAGRLFRRYSFANVMLILAQFPDATQVAGYKVWAEFDRHVVKGQRSLKIWGRPYHPTVWTDESKVDSDTKILDRKDGQVKVKAGWTRCPTLSVFDVSQTEGEPMPSLTATLEDSNGSEVKVARDMVALISAWLAANGWTLINDVPMGQANGVTSHESKTVKMAPGLSTTQYAKTLLHEMAHVILHGDNTWAKMDCYHQSATSRGEAEMQAEGTAYAVAGMMGLDTSRYSTGYVTGWASTSAASEDADRIIEATARTANAVRFAANALLDIIEGTVETAE